MVWVPSVKGAGVKGGSVGFRIFGAVVEIWSAALVGLEKVLVGSGLGLGLGLVIGLGLGLGLALGFGLGLELVIGLALETRLKGLFS